jgi:hypothetical protein
MKRLLLALGAVLLLTSCEHMDYGDCVRSEYQSSGYFQNIDFGSGVQVPMWIDTSGYVCTVYQYPDGHGPNYRAE